MNIDAQIQEILLRSSPVNDNTSKSVAACSNENKNPIYGINVIGSHNIVISSGLFSLTMLCLGFFMYFTALHQ